MTQKQLDILYDLCRTSRQILDVHFSSVDSALKVRYVDGSGNLFYRSYNVLGHFLELEI